MTPDRWKQVKGVLGAALDRPAEERGALVDAACGGDAELRTEVESLLASATAAHEFLETADRPALLRPPAEGRPEARAGARIGPYRVLSEIGRGGMGAVYLAERDDQEYRKQVAIKLVRGDADSASVVRRFRQERQILAELDHPNIARLLDGGTTDEGLPYFVMEYVEGAPIDFGIAKVLTPASASGLTATGTHLMTPEYGSPEQWRARPVTAASDI